MASQIFQGPLQFYIQMIFRACLQNTGVIAQLCSSSHPKVACNWLPVLRYISNLKGEFGCRPHAKQPQFHKMLHAAAGPPGWICAGLDNQSAQVYLSVNSEISQMTLSLSLVEFRLTGGLPGNICLGLAAAWQN